MCSFCLDLILAVHIGPRKKLRENGCLTIKAIGLLSHYALKTALQCRLRAGHLMPNDTNTSVCMTGDHGSFHLTFYIPLPIITFRKVVTIIVCVTNSSAVCS